MNTYYISLLYLTVNQGLGSRPTAAKFVSKKVRDVLFVIIFVDGPLGFQSMDFGWLKKSGMDMDGPIFFFGIHFDAWPKTTDKLDAKKYQTNPTG